MRVLAAEGIAKRFGARQVLEDASVRAEAGRITALMGRNGSGKTTLLRIAAGVLRADGGVVSFDGEPQRRLSLARLAPRGLMFVPQDQLLAPRYRVRDHFDAFAATYEVPGLGEVLRDGTVSALLDRRAGVLSGGERMRVSLALALARRPRVLIADEPLVRLAPKDQEALAAALRRLADGGTAVLTSGHDVHSLLENADSIFWCVDGTTHDLGAPADALRHERFRREYLGPTYR